MTLLVASIAVSRFADLDGLAERAWADGADAIELRVDTYRDDPDELAGYIRARRDRRWIITCRGRGEGGRCDADAGQRAFLLCRVVADTNAWVDFELADWRKDDDVAGSLASAMSRGGPETPRLILSSHDAADAPQEIDAIIKQAFEARGDAVAKVAYAVEDVSESFAALDAMNGHGHRVIAVAMGEPGMWSRVLSKKLGAFATYAGSSAATITAPGQLTLADMIDRFRWREIDSATRVFGVLGDPVAHSMGPDLFNQWFTDADINAVYLPLHVNRGPERLRRFLTGCLERPWLAIGGFSITIPHKEHALEWVGDGVDALAQSVGAVNTLLLRDGEVLGYNTDCHAAIDSLSHALGVGRTGLSGAVVDVLGTGGSARAVLAGLREIGCEVTVFGRSAERTKRIAETFSARPAVWKDRIERGGDVLINCTNVGMWPHVGDSPMSCDALHGCRLVFDLIYNPLETKLLKDARTLGVATLNGLDMFIRQAAAQFELWTSKTPDIERGRALVTEEIGRRNRKQAS